MRDIDENLTAVTNSANEWNICPKRLSPFSSLEFSTLNFIR